MGPMRFSLAGIPVRVDVSFWLIMGLFGLQRATVSTLGWVAAVEWVVLVFLGILVHELGHAVAFRAFGRPPEVTLYAMGGLTSAPGRLSPGRRLVATLAGPGVGFVVGGLVFAIVQLGLWDPRGSVLQERIYIDLLFINIGWGVLNLLPLFPLDGGQSLEALLELLKVKRAAQITSAVSLAIAVAAGVWAAQNNQVFLLLIVAFLGMTNLARLRGTGGADAPGATAGAERASPELQRSMTLAEQALQQGRGAEAVELIAQERQLRPSPAATRAYAAILARTRDLAGMERLLTEDEARRFDASTLTVLAAALVGGGRYERGLQAAEQAWSADPEGRWQPAVTAAAARAGLRDVDGAMRWLYMAASRGWQDERRLLSDPLFAEVRADPRLHELLQRMRAGAA